LLIVLTAKKARHKRRNFGERGRPARRFRPLAESIPLRMQIGGTPIAATVTAALPQNLLSSCEKPHTMTKSRR